MIWLRAGFALLVAASLRPSTFVDVTKTAGLFWRHSNGQSANRYLVETTTGGVGVFDFDNDGRPDIFLVNGGTAPQSDRAAPPRCALYRNVGSGKFVDVAQQAGVAEMPFYGMGVAAADYDNDGLTDVYVSGYPRGALFHNNGNGTFTDVTARARLENQGEWGARAAWIDFDRDGRLDLFVANYVQFSYSEQKHCIFGAQPTYCAQTEYQGSVSRLFHNDGDGMFSDVTRKAGMEGLSGRGLGVIAVDANGDGWPDLFVARDASPNLLLINQHDGTFRDKGLEDDVAYNPDGIARSGMGVDAGDINGDGLPDFVVTNFDHEYHALYLSNASGPYGEATVTSNLARYTLPYVGWGVKFLDFDNDGDQDLMIANGHIHEQINLSNREVHYREPVLLLENNGNGRFQRVNIPNIMAFTSGIVGRGLATGDFNSDGFIDAIVMNLNDHPVLVQNAAGNGNAWIGVKLIGTRSNRDAIGARLTLQSPRGTLTRWITGGSSFLSSSDQRVIFGLGSAHESGTLEILWPSQVRQRLSNLKLNTYTTIREREAD